MEEEHGHGRVGDLTRFCSSKFRSVERRFSLLGRDTLQPLGRGLDNNPVDPWVVHPACHCSRLRGLESQTSLNISYCSTGSLVNPRLSKKGEISTVSGMLMFNLSRRILSTERASSARATPLRR